jgi:hypothetical protein
VRLGEVLFEEVRINEVWTRGRFLLPPRVPNFDALAEEFEVLWVGH